MLELPTTKKIQIHQDFQFIQNTFKPHLRPLQCPKPNNVISLHTIFISDQSSITIHPHSLTMLNFFTISNLIKMHSNQIWNLESIQETRDDLSANHLHQWQTIHHHSFPNMLKFFTISNLFKMQSNQIWHRSTKYPWKTGWSFCKQASSVTNHPSPSLLKPCSVITHRDHKYPVHTPPTQASWTSLLNQWTLDNDKQDGQALQVVMAARCHQRQEQGFQMRRRNCKACYHIARYQLIKC